jgi:hypothetical protein
MVLLLKDALKQMEATDPNTGQYLPFDLGYCTYSQQRKEGGKLIEYLGARLTSNITESQNQKPEPEKDDAKHDTENSGPKRINPFHRKNETRNIELPNGQIRKIHFRFIVSFNGNKVVY